MPQYYSEKYTDIYFNPADPEAEKQFVFIETNHIRERTQQCETFTIAELGFGFGLNCALSFAAAKNADTNLKLDYFSVEEAFPEREKLLSLEADLKFSGAEYRQIWNISPQNSPAFVPLPHVPSGSVYHGSVHDFLKTANFVADVWYFDGFSPAKNPEMWSEQVFTQAFALTRPGGTFSTYSSAGWVRRNLLNAGFVVAKVSGFSSKREMLTGYRP